MYYVHPESKTPEESKAQPDAAVQPGACAWEFKGEETMHPFWAVERLADAERRKSEKSPFKMRCEDTEFSAVYVGPLGMDSIAITFAVIAPIMTNTVAVNNGGELYLETTGMKEAKRKAGSWKTDVAKADKAPRARAKAKTATNSFDVVTAI